MDDRLGTLETVAGRPVLRFVRKLPHSLERVWKAITDPAEMGHWFPAGVTTELAVGARVRFAFGDAETHSDGAYTEGEILEFDPPRVYAFRWADSVLRFELMPEGSGCRLEFSHTLSGRGTTGDRPSAARQAPGWDACLGLLAARLDGRDAPEYDGRWFLARAERYVEEFGLAEGEAVETADGWIVRFERDLVQPAGSVWATLSDGDEPVAGEAVPVRWTHGYVEPGPVTELAVGRILEYACSYESDEAGRVRFELRHQEPVGTRLVVTQTMPARLTGRRPVVLAAWQTYLELLFAALHGDVRCPWPAERTDELRLRYAERHA